MKIKEFSGVYYSFFWFSIIWSLISLLFSVFFLQISNSSDIFRALSPFIGLFIDFVLIIIVILALIYFVLGIKKRVWFSFIPFVISISILIINFAIPFADFWADLNFKEYFNARQEVVHMVESGELQSGEHGFIELPKKYKNLSKWESICVKREGKTLTVVFITYTGFLDALEGIIYRSDNKAPSRNEFEFDFSIIRKKADHWFYVEQM